MTTALHSFVRDFQYGDAPAHTRGLLQLAVLDILGVAAGACHNETSRIARDYALTHYSATSLASRLLFDGRTVHPLGAAWAGGFSIDSLDAHDGHFDSKGHAGATVVPALLTLVEAYRKRGCRISGEELLSLLCIGYETALRAGVALMQTASDYHASGSFSAIGVVCGGARLLGLSERQFRHALGIAEYFGPRCPMMRLIDNPSMLRDAHGAGAYAGINALLLAEGGITGAPADMVESAAAGTQWHDLGQRWEIDTQYFKPWPVSRWAQPALTAATGLLETYPEITPDAIEAIRIDTFHESSRLQIKEPADADQAQYSLAFPLAALLVRGKLGACEVTGEAIHDTHILALSRRIDIVEAEDLSARFPSEMLSRIAIRLIDGRTIESPATQAKGDPDTAMTREEFSDKFHLLASASLHESRYQAIEKELFELGDRRDCEKLFELLYAKA